MFQIQIRAIRITTISSAATFNIGTAINIRPTSQPQPVPTGPGVRPPHIPRPVPPRIPEPVTPVAEVKYL